MVTMILGQYTLINIFCNLEYLMATLTGNKQRVLHNRSFHSSWKVTKLLHETETKVDLAQLEKWE